MSDDLTIFLISVASSNAEIAVILTLSAFVSWRKARRVAR